jgi:hypothetical protein
MYIYSPLLPLQAIIRYMNIFNYFSQKPLHVTRVYSTSKVPFMFILQCIKRELRNIYAEVVNMCVIFPYACVLATDPRGTYMDLA